MDNLLNQIVNISKAGAYDIIVAQRDELLQENALLKSRVKFLEDLINEYTGKMKENQSAISKIISGHL